MKMTEREAIDVMNDKCEHTFLLLQTDGDFAKALATLIGAAEKIDAIRKGWEAAGYSASIFEESDEAYWKEFFASNKEFKNYAVNCEARKMFETPDEWVRRMERMERKIDRIYDKVDRIRDTQPNEYF